MAGRRCWCGLEEVLWPSWGRVEGRMWHCTGSDRAVCAHHEYDPHTRASLLTYGQGSWPAWLPEAQAAGAQGPGTVHTHGGDNDSAACYRSSYTPCTKSFHHAPTGRRAPKITVKKACAAPVTRPPHTHRNSSDGFKPSNNYTSRMYTKHTHTCVCVHNRCFQKGLPRNGHGDHTIRWDSVNSDLQHHLSLVIRPRRLA